MLSDHEIRTLRAMGAIVIEPFRDDALNPNSYDLTLGPYIARQKGKVSPLRPFETTGDVEFLIEDHRVDGEFTLDPGESILCHTNEFIGGTGVINPVDGALTPVAVNSQMRATSTAGRWNITACRCAGHGDAGYFDRWTLEVQNGGKRKTTLPVGGVICQLVFFKVATPTRLYQQASGNYQKETDLDVLMANWKPERMLPKKMKRVDDAFWKGMYK